MPDTFSEVISLTALSSHAYKSQPLSSEWSIGSVPNGGYTCSLFASAASTHSRSFSSSNPSTLLSSQPDLLHLSLQFLRRTHASHPAILIVRHVKLGSRISVLHLTLTQPDAGDGDKSLVEGYATMGNFATEEGISADVSKSFLSPTPLPADLAKLEQEGEDRLWKKQWPRPFIKFRRASQHVQMYLMKPGSKQLPPASGSALVGSMTADDLAKQATQIAPSGDITTSSIASSESQTNPSNWIGVVDEWVRFTPNSDIPGNSTTQPENFTNSTLPYLIDTFPLMLEILYPTTSFTPTPAYWYPTLTISLDLKRPLPPQGVPWLFLRCRARVIRNGRMDLDVVVLDTGGNVIAVAEHSALVVDVARNTSGRKKGGDGKGEGSEKL